MEQFANPISEQVKEVVEAVVEALRVPKPEELSPSAASSSFEAESLRGEIIRAGRKPGNGNTLTATEAISAAGWARNTCCVRRR